VPGVGADELAALTRMHLRRLCPWLSAIAVVTALALAGCGAAASPAAQVRSAWTTFKRALVDGDAKRFCAMLNDTSRTQLLATISQVSPPASSSCESAADTLFDLSRDARQKLGAAKLLSVHVSGDAATTTDTTGPPANRWVKVDGGWQLADLDLGS
jgi:hypothetical protein